MDAFGSKDDTRSGGAAFNKARTCALRQCQAPSESKSSAASGNPSRGGDFGSESRRDAVRSGLEGENGQSVVVEDDLPACVGDVWQLLSSVSSPRSVSTLLLLSSSHSQRGGAEEGGHSSWGAGEGVPAPGVETSCGSCEMPEISGIGPASHVTPSSSVWSATSTSSTTSGCRLGWVEAWPDVLNLLGGDSAPRREVGPGGAAVTARLICAGIGWNVGADRLPPGAHPAPVSRVGRPVTAGGG